MRKEEVIKEVQSIVADALGYEVKSNERIFSKGYMDSLDTLSIMMGIESKFGIEIPDDKLAELSNSESSIEDLSEMLIRDYNI